MPTTIARLWERIVEAKATFYEFLLWLNEFSVRFFESDFAVGLFGQNAGIGAVMEKYAWLPYFLMLFALAEAFFGRRFLSTQKFIVAFVVGFAIGAVYVAPTVSSIVEIDNFIIGIAFGIVFAVFRTPLYFATLTSILTYVFYYQLINTLSFVKFWAFIFAVAAVIVVLLFLLKWVELMGTALLGGWIFAASLAFVVKYPEAYADAIFRAVMLVVAILGFTVQLKWKIKKLRIRKIAKERIAKMREKEKSQKRI